MLFYFIIVFNNLFLYCYANTWQFAIVLLQGVISDKAVSLFTILLFQELPNSLLYQYKNSLLADISFPFIFPIFTDF